MAAHHLEKSILRHNSAGDRLTETKLGMLMQNHMPMSTHRSKLKQEIEFHAMATIRFPKLEVVLS